MKKVSGSLASVSMAAFLCAAAVLFQACGNSEDPWAGGAALPYQDDTAPANTTPPADTNSVGGVFLVWGDAAKDGGNEILTMVNGMDVRCVVNDSSKTPGVKGSVYYLSEDLVAATGALIIQGHTFTAKDFVSPFSGKKYRWMGWTIARSATPIVTTNPLTLSGLEGTLRAYWVTVGTEEEANAAPAPDNTDAEYAGAFVAGDESSDGGVEIYTLVNGMQVRLLANDATKIPGCVDDYYNISGDVVEEAGALSWSGNTFTARNFTSSRSGKKYRWMGWTIAVSSGPLVTTNPLTLSSFSGTLRSYWATVE